MSLIQRRVFVSGRVQGVGFRASTLHTAKAYPSLKGFVRNLPDGRVEAVFAGEMNDVLPMVAWCKSGPLMAKVTGIEVKEEPLDSTLTLFGVSGF